MRGPRPCDHVLRTRGKWGSQAEREDAERQGEGRLAPRTPRLPELGERPQRERSLRHLDLGLATPRQRDSPGRRGSATAARGSNRVPQAPRFCHILQGAPISSFLADIFYSLEDQASHPLARSAPLSHECPPRLCERRGELRDSGQGGDKAGQGFRGCLWNCRGVAGCRREPGGPPQGRGHKGARGGRPERCLKSSLPTACPTLRCWARERRYGRSKFWML